MPDKECYSWTNEEAPWWHARCTHNQHAWNVCWQVIREAEGVVILRLHCVEGTSSSLIHICVELAGVGSTCKALSHQSYHEMTEPQLMAEVQTMHRELKSLNHMP